MINKILYRNLLFSFITLICLFLFWLKYLDFYTNHDEFIILPDFSDVHVNDLDSVLDQYNLRYVIIDSIFDKSRDRGIVVNQEPEPNTHVKENRKIYLTINFLKNRKVDLPDIYDLTLRQAIRLLKRNGLKVGNLEYRADIATNKVLGFKINGLSIDVGQSLYHGTRVDLVLGRDSRLEEVIVPDLVGLSRVEADIVVKSTSLNIGVEYFRDDIVDSNSAIVYMQYPEAIEKNSVSIGSYIDLYFKHRE